MDHISTRAKWLLTGLALIITMFHLIPFYILLTTAFKRPGDFSSKWLFPEYFSLENFSLAWEQANLARAFVNTFVITASAAAILIVFGSLAAYALARRQTKLNKYVYMLFVAVMVIPPLTALVPLYQLVVDAGLMNTRFVAVLNNAAAFMPLTIFLYAGFIRSTIPKELEEAAKMDGASTIGVFFRIVFPLLKPITATVLILSSVYIWNDYQFAIFFLQDSSVQTLTVALSSFFGQNTSQLGLVGAASLLASLPMIILFLFLQRFFIEGLAAGSVKG
ncbi:carbohydrate ABC transporter permease [Domibacillus enclensis]|uniref:Carbohydrate ABC transporter membrane protein 2, CUT1 family n=1 Tax=Domibacillus enclensis TaxID=1017273 RepID=A0A1N7A0T7_9BACI|nr:carbohydrate ABC transporter permease [Domibacillus enclensis]OXS75657.1 maltose ABC transporter permease [Domibacillus enclensis]SIR32658.1 carbohydrate ABC transporter membrane protein 2, CUT1 family [Domibacillus enclensis]